MASTLSANALSWTPKLSARNGSWAERLAEAIAADITSGRLASGDQLPTQRALAQYLGITAGTVNRGYAIAERSGLIVPETGRGTFVAPPAAQSTQSTNLVPDAQSRINLALNYPAATEAEPLLRSALAALAKQKSAHSLLGLAPYEGLPKHRASGVRWLHFLGLSAEAGQVLLSSSVQHGLAATLAALAVPGDVVLTETLTSPGIKALAAMHRLRLLPVDGDDRGILPDALRHACQAANARVLYTMPTLHTPTTITMPDERRRAIAQILREQGIVAIEDDAWGFLATGAVTPLRNSAPDHVVYLTSFSKSIAAGLRVGYVVAPRHLFGSIASSLGTMTWTAPLMAEITSRWIDDGTAASIARQRKETARQRQRLAAKLLGSSVSPSTIPAFHIWLPISEPWRIDEFVHHAATLGVSLAPTDLFVPARDPAPHAIRVCTGNESDPARVEDGLRVLARMLKSGPSGYSIAAV